MVALAAGFVQALPKVVHIRSKHASFKAGLITLAAYDLQLVTVHLLPSAQTDRDADHNIRNAGRGIILVSGRSLTKRVVVSDRSVDQPTLELFGCDPPHALVVANAVKFASCKRAHDA